MQSSGASDEDTRAWGDLAKARLQVQVMAMAYYYDRRAERARQLPHVREHGAETDAILSIQDLQEHCARPFNVAGITIRRWDTEWCVCSFFTHECMFVLMPLRQAGQNMARSV